MILKVFWIFEWVPDLSISWTNKRDNKKLENWNPLPTFYFARSLYFYKYHFLSLSFHKRTFEHQCKQGSNLAIQEQSLKWNAFKKENVLHCPFPPLAQDQRKSLQRHVLTAALRALSTLFPGGFEHFLLPLLCQGCSYLAHSALAQQCSNALPSGGGFAATPESLDHQFCEAGCQRSWW